MSKTLPTIVKFSSATSQPIFGGVSVFIIMPFDGVIFNALPILCKFIPSENHQNQCNSVFKVFVFLFVCGEILVLFGRKLI